MGPAAHNGCASETKWKKAPQKVCEIITRQLKLLWQVVQPVIVLENLWEFHEQNLHPRALDKFYISCDQNTRSMEDKDFDLELVFMVTGFQKKKFDLLIQRCCWGENGLPVSVLSEFVLRTDSFISRYIVQTGSSGIYNSGQICQDETDSPIQSQMVENITHRCCCMRAWLQQRVRSTRKNGFY